MITILFYYFQQLEKREFIFNYKKFNRNFQNHLSSLFLSLENNISNKK